jgi:hypothetical protein
MSPRKLGTSWVELLRQHLEDHHAKTIHQIIYDADFADIESRVLGVDLAKGDDHSVVVTGRRNDGFIIIDEVRPLLKEELELLLKEFGAKKPKPMTPNRQPDWARHNQAPRSFRRR